MQSQPFFRTGFIPTGTSFPQSVPASSSSSTPGPCSEPQSLKEIAHMLVRNSLAKSSHSTYLRAQSMYSEFARLQLGSLNPFPASVEEIMLFVAHCFTRSFSPSTVSTYISALGYLHKLASHPDPTQIFVVKKCIMGYHKLRARPDTRLPITLPILKRLVASLVFITNSHFLRVLFKQCTCWPFMSFLE